MSLSELVYYTRIRIHALEKAQINEQSFAMALQFIELVPFFKRCERNGLFSANELSWAKRIIYGKEEVESDSTATTEDVNYFSEILQTRRSVRKYKNVEVSDHELNLILKNALWAPSACNRQPWRFIIMKEKKELELFASFIQQFIKNAPVGILIVQSKDAYNDIDVKYTPFLDAGFVAQNILLSAHNLGLGACFVNVGDYELTPNQKDQIRCRLKIPQGWLITGLITLGYSAHVPRAPGRKSCADLQMFNCFEPARNYDGK